MNFAAFLLAVVAIIIFVAAWLGSQVRRPLLPLGLAVLVVAWIVQLIWRSNTIHTSR